MSDMRLKDLSRRERQIMNIIYQKKRATVQDVLDNLDDPPSYSAVRAFLRILEEKGFLNHGKEGLKYFYIPAISVKKAMKNDIKQILRTYFNNSVEKAVAAIIDLGHKDLNEEDYNNLLNIINNAKKEEKED